MEIDSLVQSLNILTANDPSSNKELRHFLDTLKLPPLYDKQNQGLMSTVVDQIKQVDEQAKKVVDEGKELIFGDPSKVKAIKRQNPQLIEQFNNGLIEIGSSVKHMNDILLKEISTRRMASIRNQEMHKRNHQVQVRENENLGLYQLLETCLLRLTEIPNMVSCFVLGCDGPADSEDNTTPMESEDEKSSERRY